MALVFMPILAAAKWGGFESIGGDGNADCDTLRGEHGFEQRWLSVSSATLPPRDGRVQLHDNPRPRQYAF